MDGSRGREPPQRYESLTGQSFHLTRLSGRLAAVRTWCDTTSQAGAKFRGCRKIVPLLKQLSVGSGSGALSWSRFAGNPASRLAREARFRLPVSQVSLLPGFVLFRDRHILSSLVTNLLVQNCPLLPSSDRSSDHPAAEIVVHLQPGKLCAWLCASMCNCDRR